jgi:hypothetical protein
MYIPIVHNWFLTQRPAVKFDIHVTMHRDKFDIHVTVHRDKFDVHMTVHLDKFDVHMTVHRDKFDVHVTVHRDKFDVHITVHRDKFLTIKPTRCTNFSNFILEMKLYRFRRVPLSIIRRSLLYTQQRYMLHSRIRMELRSILILLASCQQACRTYTVVVCIVKNS